jgi:hypothetical protein
MINLGGGAFILEPTKVATSASSRFVVEVVSHKDIWDIISTVGILLAGFGGLKIMLDYLNLKNIGLQLKTQKYKIEYPINMLGKTYYIWKYDGEDAIWLIDLKRKIRRHIANQETNSKMGWKNRYILVTKEKIEKYEQGEKIDTKSLAEQ